MKTKSKNVQVFTKGDSEYCEVNAELANIHYKEGVLFLKTKEEDGSVWEHHFPLWYVRMVRIS